MNSMNFPNAWRKFLQEYSFKDKEQIYTNGSELIPVFRVEQMIEQYLVEKQTCEYWYQGYYKLLGELANYKWVSVRDRLPETPKPDEGYCCFLVSDGSLIHMAYYTEDGWLFTDSGEMKEMFYKVTHWMPLPDYPNHLKSEE